MYYVCEDTEEEFTTTALDEVPNISNGRMINSITRSPRILLAYIDSAKNVLGADCLKIRNKVEANLSIQTDNSLTQWIFSDLSRDRFNGYAKPDVGMLKNVILFFIENMGNVFKTQMNKLLFYSDFAHYREYGISLTGLRYRAIQFGPVPLNWDRVYCAFEEIQPELVDCGAGIIGELLTSDIKCDISVFNEGQKALLDKVLLAFKGMSGTRISKLSHEEDAWKKNIGSRSMIDYSYSFCLKNV